MAETRHKSLPWKREGQYIVDALGCSVLTVHAGRDARAHADMILSGVNEHDSLVEARAAWQSLCGVLRGIPLPPTISADQIAARMARLHKALANQEKGQD